MTTDLFNRFQLPREAAIAEARRIQNIDPEFDLQLAKQISNLDPEKTERALDILDEISPGRRIVPLVRSLIHHPDPRVSAKATVLIGRRIKNPLWVKRLMAKVREPRVRANAIESLWGMATPTTLDIFREALKDPDNLVVGCALIGLHKAGDPEIVARLKNLSSDPDPKLRTTAVWAMGRIKAPVFHSVLASLSKDPHPEVRRAALRSLKILPH